MRVETQNFSVGFEKISFPFVSINKTIGHYQVKTATDESELRNVFKLRYEVFFREFAGVPDDGSSDLLDIEDHDYLCDHLIVRDLRSGDVVACYRLLASRNKPAERIYYSESEFVIDEFLATGEPKLELGRACVHRDYRRGTVITLLWRGLIEYAVKCEVKYLFGCSSISKEQFPLIPQILMEIRSKDKVIKEWKLGVREKYEVDLLKVNNYSLAVPKPQTSLMQIYLNAGAKVGEKLAYDRAMNCIDLFTVLDFDHLPKVFLKGLS